MPNKSVFSIVGILALIAMYAIINFVIVGGQKLMDRDENKRFDVLKTEIEQGVKQIKLVESELSNFEDELTDIEAMLDSETDEGTFNELVERYNGKLEVYNSKYDHYIIMLDEYNEKVDEANELSEKVGSTWYVLPIPIGKK